MCFSVARADGKGSRSYSLADEAQASLSAPLSTYVVEVVTEGAVAMRGTIGTYLRA